METRAADGMSAGRGGGHLGGGVRKVSIRDMKMVQYLIERCLQLYMNQKEVMEALSIRARIEPGFTELVWQKLEEQNQEFFKAYYVRLMLKKQIIMMNKLLDDQYQLMSKEHPSAVPYVPHTSNVSESSTLNQNASLLPNTAPGNAMPDMFQHDGASSSSVMMNGAPAADHFTHPGEAVHDLPPSGMDASPGNTELAFCNYSTLLEPCQPAGDASQLNEQPLGDPFLEMDPSLYGFLSQIPLNFSFPDLTEDFNHCTEILENFGRSPFIPFETNNLSGPIAGVHTEIGNTRLDTISEVLGYEDFGSH